MQSSLSYRTLVKDAMLLYRHSARCPAAMQMFLDVNPRYWPFVPMTIDLANEQDRIQPINLTRTIIVPPPPHGYRFSQQQQQAQLRYFQDKQDLLMPEPCLDLYNATIVAVCTSPANEKNLTKSSIFST